MFDFIAFPMGQVLNFLYKTVAFNRYGFAIILLTVIIRLILLPLYIKQYRSTSKMQVVQPQIQEIQKRYKNDKEKLNQEMMKVYQENKVNPAGGCLPLIIQMPILFSLFYAITQPLKYMLNMSASKIAQLTEQYKIAGGYYPQIKILNEAGKAGHKILDMSFLGLNLGLTPTFDTKLILSDPQYIALLFVPILAAATTFLSIKLSTPPQQPNTSGQKSPLPASSIQNSMMYIMPFTTAFFAFSVPAGMGLYWIIGNVFQIFQQLYMNKYIIKKKEVSKK